MQQAYYVRNLSNAQKKAGISNLKFCSSLGISFSTLRRIKSGRPTTGNIARRIIKRAKHSGKKILVTYERPCLTLKLKIDPRRVRYVMLETIDQAKLISPDVLEQVVQGAAFTKSFGKILRTFLKDMLIGNDEYFFEPVSPNSKVSAAKEWRHRIPSLTSGDQFFDLYIFVREQFRVFLEHDSVIDAKKLETKKSGVAKITELQLPKFAFESLSKAEQNLLLAFGLASNELAFLVRLATISGYQIRPGRMHDAFQFSQQMTIVKLFAGKIYECWNLIRIRYFGSGLSRTYDRLLRPGSRSGLIKIKRYFNNPKNIIALFRNEAAFHYSRDELHTALGSLEERDCRVYLAGPRNYFELYHFAELAMAGHLLQQINIKHHRAMHAAQQDIARIGGEIGVFFQDVLSCILKKAGKFARKKGRMIIRDVGLERKKDISPIPIFIRPTDYYNEFLKISKALKR